MTKQKERKPLVICTKMVYIIGRSKNARQGGVTIEQKGAFIMKKYVCDICGYEYDEAKGDPEHGIAPGTKWEQLPADFVCPICGVGKDQFSEQ